MFFFLFDVYGYTTAGTNSHWLSHSKSFKCIGKLVAIFPSTKLEVLNWYYKHFRASSIVWSSYLFEDLTTKIVYCISSHVREFQFEHADCRALKRIKLDRECNKQICHGCQEWTGMIMDAIYQINDSQSNHIKSYILLVIFSKSFL